MYEYEYPGKACAGGLIHGYALYEYEYGHTL
jgi:hypothetical protein